MGMRPIRVAQIVGQMNGGGVEAVVMNYYRHIDRRKVQFDFIVNEGSTLVPEDEIISLGGRVFYVPGYTHLPDYLKKIRSLICQERWQIIHSHVNALSVFPLYAAKKAGAPIRIAHSHSTSGKGEYAKNMVKALLKTASNRYPTRRFACSKFAGDWLFGESVEYEIVYNAVDLASFAFSEDIRNEARMELGLAENTFVVGHVGRFMQQKNHDFLIDIFNRVLDLEPNSALVLVGDGELLSQVKGKVSKLGIEDKVLFLGQRPDVQKLYQAFDAFLLPSLYEGLCLVGVEAQRASLPCLFSDAITEEVLLTDGARMISLDESVDVWANELLSVKNRIEIDQESFSDYEISTAAKRLEKKYEEMLFALRQD